MLPERYGVLGFMYAELPVGELFDEGTALGFVFMYSAPGGLNPLPGGALCMKVA